MQLVYISLSASALVICLLLCLGCVCCHILRLRSKSAQYRRVLAKYRSEISSASSAEISGFMAPSDEVDDLDAFLEMCDTRPTARQTGPAEPNGNGGGGGGIHAPGVPPPNGSIP